MCFGRRASSAYSSSSSSSDEVIARVIDLPTVRRMNSPRCAPRGNAYDLGSEAASDSAATTSNKANDKMKTGGGTTSKPDGNAKQGDLRHLHAVYAVLTRRNSQQVVSPLSTSNQSLSSHRRAFSSGEL